MSVTGAYLLFAPGTRLSREDIVQLVASLPNIAISHDPSEIGQVQLEGSRVSSAQVSADFRDTTWLELLRDGLTFDLFGLAPGPSLTVPTSKHAFDFRDVENVSSYDALMIAPGPHLVGGEKTLPIVRGLMGLVCEVIRQFGSVLGVVWQPSQSVIGSRYFESTVSAWLEGGPFPALGLTAFTEATGEALESVGLSHFINRELRLEPPLAGDKIAVTRLGIRLINQLVLMGGIEGEERVIAPDGTQLVLRQSDDQRFIRVWAD